jgi:4-amino-4-deoxy-L-arabinose transferase-like glycosyltransferase
LPQHQDPTPAIVAQNAVRPLPRIALWLFCLAYLVPGLVGREPWKGEELQVFGQMLALAQGQSSWLHPTVWGQTLPLDAPLAYWMGAWAIGLAPSWLSAGSAARIPFALLLALTMFSTWKAAYYLGLGARAQPVAFAFGGEAKPKDYARTIADSATLALIACLGLALLSHEATPMLMQFSFFGCAFLGASALPYHPFKSSMALVVALAGLSFSGAPTLSVLLATGVACIIFFDKENENTSLLRMYAYALLACALGIAAIAHYFDLFHWRISSTARDWNNWRGLVDLLVWFMWPAWPLVLWTLWQWRRQWLSQNWSRHLVLPLWFIALALCVAFMTRTEDQTLMLVLPPMATLAAFALPTFRRSFSAFIDWFTLIFFTGCAFIIWVIWIAMQTGWPPQPAANVARLAPGFVPSFSVLAFVFALMATAIWAWLVKWRVGRHRQAIWKSLVLPSGGAALCWLLLMSLWLPLLDFARSYVPWVQQIQQTMKAQGGSSSDCMMTYGLNVGQMTAFHYHGGFEIKPLDNAESPQNASCRWLMVDNDSRPELAQVAHIKEWRRIETIKRPANKNEDVTLYLRRVQ